METWYASTKAVCLRVFSLIMSVGGSLRYEKYFMGNFNSSGCYFSLIRVTSILEPGVILGE